MNKVLPLSALAVACATSPLALANNKLEEMIVTSSRVEMPLRQIGTSVSVIGDEEIRQRGFNSLYEVLRSQPAVAVSNNGGAGKTSSLRIRGEESFRTLMLVDGIDVSDTTSPQIAPRIEHILSSGIQRVEILRGPQGLMYGADAGGVINIISDAPTEDGLGGGLSAEGGRYGTQQIAGNVGGGNDQADFILSASDFETDGFNAKTTDTMLRDDDGYENTTVHGKAGWNVTEDLRLELVGRDTDSNSEYDDCYSTASTNVCDSDYDQTTWRAAADYTAGAFTHQLAYNSSETETAHYADGSYSYGSEGELERWSYLGTLAAADSQRIVYGADIETSKLVDDFNKAERDEDGYYLEYQGGFSDSLFLTAGVRYDDNEDFDSHTSYRVSGAYLFTLNGGELKLKSTYGTGFRAPSLYEISYNNSAGAYPPASEITLSEEQSEGLDIGLSWYDNSGLYLEAVYFNQTVSDEIYFDQINWSGYLQDKGDTDSKGVELIGEMTLMDSLTLSGNYTYNDTDTVSGSSRIRRPEHLVNLGVSWQALDSRLVLGLNVRGAYESQDIDGAQIDDYEVVNINASFEVLDGLQVYGRVENLLDEDYEEVPTYNTSGAAAYAGVRYSF